LMRIFGAERLDATLQKLGIEEGEAIVHPWINKALEKAQMRVEARNYDIRKHLLKFDDVMNDQRKVIYAQRHELMADDKDFSEDIDDMREEAVTDVIYSNVAENTPSEFWDYQLINDQLSAIFGSEVALDKEENLSRDEAVDLLLEKVRNQAKSKEETYTAEIMRYMERTILLRLIDQYWKEHLLNLDRLRQGINLRAYGQRDPLNEYKQEAFVLFENMSKTIRRETVRTLALFEFARPDQMEDDFSSDDDVDYDSDDLENVIDESDSEIDSDAGSKTSDQQLSGDVFAVSRNALCPCGSGKKYKYCHGKITE